MSGRYKRNTNIFLPLGEARLFTALIAKLKEGYSLSEVKSDVLSGLVVALVAIPLGMALAIASGVAPQHGLYTVIIGGSVVALLGGSRFQVSGPTAAFVVILFPIVQKFGLSGLFISGLMAGVILVAMGYARMGRLIQFIPYPVTTGFTSGIAVVIAVLQMKDFFGLKIHEMPESFVEKIYQLFYSFPTISVVEMTIGIVTLLILVLWPKINNKIPSPLIAISLVTVACAMALKAFPSLEFATIGSRFAMGIPQSLPNFHWPWNNLGAGESPFVLSFETVRMLVPSAFAIAMLGAIESLLSAVVADGMTRIKHDPDGELVALGIGNIVCPFFGGIPATGAIARTATNIRFGARSPFSSIFHAFFTLITILLFAPYISYLPMSALSALLLLIAYNMSEHKHFRHILRVAPKSDVIVLLICFSLTVVFDMVVGVTVGVVLAALLFMRRMAEVTDSHKLVNGKELNIIDTEVPASVVIYEIEGPLFFGAAEKAAESLSDITDEIKGVIFLLYKVPTMDVTGLVALEGAINKLRKGDRKICLTGLRQQPKEMVRKSVLISNPNDIFISDHVDEAIELVTTKTTSLHTNS